MTLSGEPVELTVVAADHVVYGLLASRVFTAPDSVNHVEIFELNGRNMAVSESAVPVWIVVAEPQVSGDPERDLIRTS
jgi:hypothetical protein